MDITKSLAALLVAASGLAACGDNPGQQAALGAGAGAAGAIVIDGDPLAGAVVGAAGNLAYCHQYPSRC